MVSLLLSTLWRELVPILVVDKRGYTKKFINWKSINNENDLLYVYSVHSISNVILHTTDVPNINTNARSILILYPLLFYGSYA